MTQISFNRGGYERTGGNELSGGDDSTNCYVTWSDTNTPARYTSVPPSGEFST